MTFAAQTEVPVERTRMEIEKTIAKYGATSFVSGYHKNDAFIQFMVQNRYVRFVLHLPGEMEYAKSPKGRNRSAVDRKTVYDQAMRQKWRALLLVLKAKLESVEAGVASFEQEFLAHILLPNGQTAGEWMAPQIRHAYEGGQMPAMLPGIGETHHEDEDGDDGDAHPVNE